MKYNVIRETNFMGIKEVESEGVFETIELAKSHIKEAQHQEKNLMGRILSKFEIKEE